MRVLVGLLATVLLAGAGCQDRGAGAAATPVVDLLDLEPERALAESRLLDLGGRGRRALVEGWSRPQVDPSGKRFVWATATESTLRFHLFRAQAQQMLVTLWPYPDAAPLRVRVVVNGHDVGGFEADGGGFLEHRIVIPEGALLAGSNLLAFRHSALARGPNPNDPRSFAAAYSTILVGPDCGRLRALGMPPVPGIERRLPEGWRVTAPTRFSWNVTIPSATRLRLRFAQPEKNFGPIEAKLVLRDGGRIVPLGRVTIERGRFSSRRVELVADVSAYAGRQVDLRLALEMPRCGPPSGTTVLEQAVLELSTK